VDAREISRLHAVPFGLEGRKKEKKGKEKGKDPFFMQYSESLGWLAAGARAEVNLKF